MSITLKLLLVLLGIIFFVLKALNVPSRFDFAYAGWACIAAAVLLA